MNWLKQFWKALNTPTSVTGAKVRSFRPTPAEDAYCNLSPRAQQVLALARKEADRFHHNFVGTEHLLLGLIALGQGVAVNVLRKLGLDLESVRKSVETQVGTGPDQRMIGNIPYTPRVKKVLALAVKEARALNHTYVGTEHILLGLLREGDGVAARVLANLQVNIEQIRTEILKELDPNFALDYSTPEPAPVKETTPPLVTASTTQTVHAVRLQARTIDVSKRYDVYCSEGNQNTVYRNVRFKGMTKVFPQNHQDDLDDYYELEQADGQIVFVVKYSVIKFCEAGVIPNADQTPGNNP